MRTGRLVLIRVVVVETLALGDECPFQDHLPLLVPLVLLRRELVDPAELRLAVLARDVAHHVAAGEHDAVLHVAEVQVDNSVEEERSARRAREPRRDQLGAIRQRDVAAGTREQTRPAQVVQEDPPHLSAL